MEQTPVYTTPGTAVGATAPTGTAAVRSGFRDAMVDGRVCHVVSPFVVAPAVGVALSLIADLNE